MVVVIGRGVNMAHTILTYMRYFPSTGVRFLRCGKNFPRRDKCPPLIVPRARDDVELLRKSAYVHD